MVIQKELRTYIKHFKSIRTFGLVASSSLVFLLAFSVFPITHQTEIVEATPGQVEVPSLSVSTNSISIDLTPKSPNGTFVKSADNASVVTVSTSNYTGYELKIKATDTTNPTKLINTNDNTAYLDTISTATSETNFKADNATAATNYNGKWGYKPSYFNTAVNTNYLPSPTTSYTTLNKTNLKNGSITTCTDPANSNCSTHQYDIGIAARADYMKPTGTYTNTYEIIALANPVAYAINYYDGVDNTNPIGTQVSQTNTAATITLNPTYTSGSAPTRSTYTFKSWCKGSSNTVPVNTTTTYDGINKVYNNPATICNGTEYTNGANFDLDPTISNQNINLYAVWTPTTVDKAYQNAGKTKETTSGYQYYKMQDMTTAICNAITINQYGTVVDVRVNGSNASRMNYKIAKLDDGRCWMLDNLNLDLTNSTVINSLSTSNTNVNAASLTSLKSGNRSAGARYATAGLGGANWTTSSNNAYSVPMAKVSGNCSTSTSVNPCAYTGSYTSSTVLSTKAANSSFGLGFGRIGMFYNYCAASAGNYCFGSNGYADADAGSPSGDAQYDICPKSWKMPGQDNFYNLCNTINGGSCSAGMSMDANNPMSMQFKLSATLSGSSDGGTTYSHGGNNGTNVIWTATYWKATGMSNQMLRTSTVLGLYTNYRYNGLSVRCLAKY